MTLRMGALKAVQADPARLLLLMCMLHMHAEGAEAIAAQLQQFSHNFLQVHHLSSVLKYATCKATSSETGVNKW